MNLKLRRICSVFFLLTIYSCKQQPDCFRFKNGRFEFRSRITKDEYSIERRDSVQIEKDMSTGQIVNNRITWISPCEYHITGIDGINGPQDSATSSSSSIPVKVKILKTTQSYYTFMVQMDSGNKSLQYTDTMWLENFLPPK